MTENENLNQQDNFANGDNQVSSAPNVDQVVNENVNTPNQENVSPIKPKKKNIWLIIIIVALVVVIIGGVILMMMDRNTQEVIEETLIEEVEVEEEGGEVGVVVEVVVEVQDPVLDQKGYMKALEETNLIGYEELQRIYNDEFKVSFLIADAGSYFDYTSQWKWDENKFIIGDVGYNPTIEFFHKEKNEDIVSAIAGVVFQAGGSANCDVSMLSDRTLGFDDISDGEKYEIIYSGEISSEYEDEWGSYALYQKTKEECGIYSFENPDVNTSPVGNGFFIYNPNESEEVFAFIRLNHDFLGLYFNTITFGVNN